MTPLVLKRHGDGIYQAGIVLVPFSLMQGEVF
jgi:hypothetical protein